MGFCSVFKSFFACPQERPPKLVLYETPNLGFIRKPSTMGFCKVYGGFTKGFLFVLKREPFSRFTAKPLMQGLTIQYILIHDQCYRLTFGVRLSSHKSWKYVNPNLNSNPNINTNYTAIYIALSVSTLTSTMAYPSSSGSGGTGLVSAPTVAIGSTNHNKLK